MMQEIDVLQLTGDRELKAYIYQQLVDIQPLLASDAQLAVLVQDADSDLNESTNVTDKKDMAKKDKTHESGRSTDYLVTLVVSFEEGRVEAEGQAADIYDAFSDAKEQLVFQLSELQNATISSQERAMQIQSIVSGNYMVH